MQEEEGSSEKPDFLPMFPWYSGTSADMYRTIFDLLISLKLFLGRYDMRQMQVCPSGFSTVALHTASHPSASYLGSITLEPDSQSQGLFLDLAGRSH